MTATVERGRRPIMAAAILALSSCGSSPVKSDRAVTSAGPENQAADALEALATDSGVIGEDGSDNPVGAYGRRYDGGEDRLCIASRNPAVHPMPFTAEIRIGDEEYCKGRGTAQRSGKSMVLRFDGGGCTIAARFEGDRIVVPGAVDRGCASLCSGRGSFAGVTFPRTGIGNAAALAVVARDGNPLCDK